ncbi:hypothetical protein HOLleu_16398 [Holothuria leucospilota]|uniref:Endonuclease n=1 Tax=Holothuria leucospilota TaxID=206669 RepID=A0A9Q1HAW9_HOLLE|nr:hypothetical protein HOLleu_16398 [Holothuria leucospilota]
MMAQPQQRLRVTDFLPTRFCGDKIDRDLCTAHFYTFVDYLEAHDLHEPADEAALHNVVQLFKRSLQGSARLWIEGKVFETLQDLQTSFTNRFSPSHSQFAHVAQFESITYTRGESAEQHLSKISQLAQIIGYGEDQVRDKFLSTLPPKCRTAVLMSTPDNNLETIVSRTQCFFDLQNEKASRELSFSSQEVNPAPNAAIYDEIAQLKGESFQSAPDPSPYLNSLRTPTKPKKKQSNNDHKAKYLDKVEAEIHLTSSNYAKGYLPDKKGVVVLFDSGSTRSIIAQSFVESSKYLSQTKCSQVNPITFRLGNGSYLTADTMIEFEISIQERNFRISAMVVKNLIGIDLILGSKTLAELDGILEFKTNTFRIAPKKLHLRPSANVVIKPGQEKYITLRGKVPPYLRNAETIHVAPDKPLASLHLSQLVDVVQTLPSQYVTELSGDDALHKVSVVSSESQPVESTIVKDRVKKYPHLDPNDPILKLSENEIIHKYVNLSQSLLTSDEKEEVYDLIFENRQAISLYGELSSCPDFEVDIELSNDDPFYIRPYFASDSDKQAIDKELNRLVKLGILSIGHQSYTSPVLLISKKGTSEKRVVTDFRYLNSRIRKINHPFPLLSETLKTIGNSEARVLSVVDIKSAFHCLPLSKHAQQFTGISSYNGGNHFYYKRLPQGLNISPGIFQAKINDILHAIPNSKDFCIAHHDDIILFSKDKCEHKKHLTWLLKCLADNGLKVCPKKCKLFRNSVLYMGHKIFVDEKNSLCIQPLADRCEAIRQMKRPKTPKEARRFVGAVNYISSFFPKIQSVLKPIHQLARKHKKFVWNEEHEIAFEQIRSMMTKPPILHLPRSTGTFNLYSDTSRIATGSYLTQTVEDKEYIVGYYSKVLPPACQNYSVTELEMFGLLINITAFKHLLKPNEFNAFVDHSSIVQILQSKDEPSTSRLRKLILKLSDYSFKIGYKKGSDLVLADFLSRNPNYSHSEIDEVIPIAFSLFASELLIDHEGKEPVCNPIVTRSYAKKHGIDVPDLFPDGLKRRETVSVPTQSCGENSQTNGSVVNPPSNSGITRRQFPLHRPMHLPDHGHQRNEVRDTQPVNTRPPPHVAHEPRLVDRETDDDIRDPPPELYRVPNPLISKVDGLVTRHVPKQAELDKMMNIIKRKIIRDYNLPIDVKQLKTEQETSSYFKPVYDYLAYDILPKDKKAAKSVQMKAEQYILCNGILFRLFFHDKDEEFTLQLAIPESLSETIISRYHDNLLCNHQGVVRTYVTVRRNFYMPNMFDTISKYVKSCLRCQQFRDKPDSLRPYHMRVPDTYRPFDRVSLDFKSMPTSPTGFKHLMVACCEITRFIICAPMRSLDAESICEVLIQKIICIFGPPSCLITDSGSSLTGKLVQLLCNTLQIDQRIISVENHGSLQVERHIQTIANFVKVNLNQFGTDWVRFVATSSYAYNSFSSPYLGNYSPYELAFGRKAPDLSNLSFNPMSGMSQSYEDYVEHLKEKFQAVSKTILSLQKKHQERQNVEITQKLSKMPVYSVGQLVYLYKPSSSSLTANSKKIRAEWCGPLVVHQILDRTHYILATLKGEILHDVFNYNRLKPAFIRASSEKNNITHLQKLKEALGKATSDSSDQKASKSIEFTDERGNSLPTLTREQVMCVRQSESVELEDYINCLSVNNGLAVPYPISRDQLEKQFNLIVESPTDNEMTIRRARFQAGKLQVLLSFAMTSKDGKNQTCYFWWNIETYPESKDIVTSILTDRRIQLSGTPQRFLRKLHV